MLNSQLNPPTSNEVEVSVFGPGYGEAIVLHIGEGKWVLVDSCIEPDSEQPAPLKYLRQLDIDVRNAVKLIVATHWHDDHVRGISTIFNECESASIAISSVLKVGEFLKLVALYRRRTVMESSGLDEFSRLFQLLEARKQQRVRVKPPGFALMDRLLYREPIELASETVEAKVYALSPSDASVLQAKLTFAELLPEERERKKRLVSPAPNLASVVLWVEVGNHKMLFGADLERTTDPKTGWSVILSDSTVISGKANVFKIPHHGSGNAHHEGVWSRLLLPEPSAIVSPFRRGWKMLPSPVDIKRITRLTSHAYATGLARPRSRRWRNRVVRDFVREVTRDIQSVHHGWGQVRLRKKINETNGSWSVELFGDAYALKAL